MALSNSQYDAIMREYGRQQIENHHKLEERRQEIYARLPVVRQLEAEIAERSVACAKKLLEGDKSVLDRLKEDLKDLREQKSLIIRAAGYPDDYLELHYRCPDCRDTGLIDGRKCHCFLQAQMKLLHACLLYTLRAHETDSYLVCRLLLEKKKTNRTHRLKMR